MPAHAHLPGSDSQAPPATLHPHPPVDAHGSGSALRVTPVLTLKKEKPSVPVRPVRVWLAGPSATG